MLSRLSQAPGKPIGRSRTVVVSASNHAYAKSAMGHAAAVIAAVGVVMVRSLVFSALL
jgi:hypothetical protein